MTNREKYITKRDEYDLMMTIQSTGCPIWIVTGDAPSCWDNCIEDKEMCSSCVQQWLNEEADQPKPQWHDSLMKSFLRKG